MSRQPENVASFMPSNQAGEAKWEKWRRQQEEYIDCDPPSDDLEPTVEEDAMRGMGMIP